MLMVRSAAKRAGSAIFKKVYCFDDRITELQGLQGTSEDPVLLPKQVPYSGSYRRVSSWVFNISMISHDVEDASLPRVRVT